jgi:hypothetical protein
MIKINTIKILSNPFKKKIAYDKYNHKNIIKIRESSKIQREAGKQKQYRQQNKDKNKQYCLTHRNHDITSTEWENILKIFNYRCAYCGKPLAEQLTENNEQFHKEHVCYYGANDIRNCVPACTSCNDSKWMYSLYEWYNPDNPKYNFNRLDKIIWWCFEGYKQYIEEKPPYKIVRKQNENSNTYHFQLWTVDPERKLLQCVAKKPRKKDLDEDIKILLELLKEL